MVNRVVHREYLGRSSFKAFGAQRLLEPRCEGIVCLRVLPHGDGEEVFTLTHTGVSVLSVRTFGHGSRAAVEIGLSNGDTMCFDSVRDRSTERPSMRGGVPVLKRLTVKPSSFICWASSVAGDSPARPAGTWVSNPRWIRPRRKVPAVRITAAL